MLLLLRTGKIDSFIEILHSHFCFHSTNNCSIFSMEVSNICFKVNANNVLLYFSHSSQKERGEKVQNYNFSTFWDRSGTQLSMSCNLFGLVCYFFGQLLLFSPFHLPFSYIISFWIFFFFWNISWNNC